MNWTPEMKRLCDAETKRKGLAWLCYEYNPEEGQCMECRKALRATFTQEYNR